MPFHICKASADAVSFILRELLTATCNAREQNYCYELERKPQKFFFLPDAFLMLRDYMGI